MERSIEAGRAAGSLMGTGLGAIATVVLFIFRGFWEQAGAHPLMDLIITALLSLFVAIAFQFGGVTIGMLLGMAFWVGYERLPGRSSQLKGVLMGFISWPIFLLAESVLHFLGRTFTVEVFLAEFWWPLLGSTFGIIHEIYRRRLEQPGQKTFLQRFEKAHPRFVFDLTLSLFAVAFLLNILLLPYAVRLGYKGPLPAFVTDPGSLVWIVLFLSLLGGFYMAFGHAAWFERKLARIWGKKAEP